MATTGIYSPLRIWRNSGTVTTVQEATVEAIGAWLTIHMPEHPVKITFGAPDRTALDGGGQGR